MIEELIRVIEDEGYDISDNLNVLCEIREVELKITKLQDEIKKLRRGFVVERFNKGKYEIIRCSRCEWMIEEIEKNVKKYRCGEHKKLLELLERFKKELI